MTFTVGQQVTSVEAASLPDGSLYTWTLTEQYEIRDGVASYLAQRVAPPTRTITFLPLDPEPPVGSVWRVPNEGTPLGDLFTRYAVTDSDWWCDENAEWTDWATLNERGGTLIYRAEATT